MQSESAVRKDKPLLKVVQPESPCEAGLPMLRGLFNSPHIKLPDNGLMRALRSVRTIDEMESIMLHLPQPDVPTYHYIENGVYVREIFIPRHTFLIGYAHTESYSQVCSMGNQVMFSEDGHCDLVGAPYSGVGPANQRKVSFSLEDTVWTTFHACGDETDPEEAYKATIAPSKTAIAFTDASEDRADYEKFLEDEGLTHEQVAFEASIDDGMIELDLEEYGICFGISPIHCAGMFATRDFKSGSVIMPVSIDNHRTLPDRYTNHAKNPNCKPLVSKGGVEIVAARDIKKGDEITVDYRDSIASRKESSWQDG